MESTAATTQLIQSTSKSNDMDFVSWQRTLRAMVNMVHPEISETLDGQLRPESLYRSRRDHGRPGTRSEITSCLALADALEGEEPTTGGEGRVFGRTFQM